MKKAILPLVILTSLLASCGSKNDLPIENTNSNVTGTTTVAPAPDPSKVAQYLADAGFTKNDADVVLKNLEFIKIAKAKQNSNINQQSIEDDVMSKSMNLISNGTVSANKSTLMPQTVGRAEVVQAARNISLYSMENFQYYQNQNYLKYNGNNSLIYDDDGCSAPDIMVAANYIFYDACDQHDFGYRNGLYSELHNPSFKQAVDEHLYYNAVILCDRYQPGWAMNQTCKGDAATFYVGVTLPIVASNWLAKPSK